MGSWWQPQCSLPPSCPGQPSQVPFSEGGNPGQEGQPAAFAGANPGLARTGQLATAGSGPRENQPLGLVEGSAH